MAQRTFSVIILPDAWGASIDELARLVAPFTSVRATQLVKVLQRGPMTLDADLSSDEANRLFARLSGADVPVEVRDGDGGVVMQDGGAEISSATKSVLRQTEAEATALSFGGGPAAGSSDEDSSHQDMAEELESISDGAVDEDGEDTASWGDFLSGVGEVDDIDLPHPNRVETDQEAQEPADAATGRKKRRSSTQLGAPGFGTGDPPSSSRGGETKDATSSLQTNDEAPRFGEERGDASTPPSGSTESTSTSPSKSVGEGAAASQSIESPLIRHAPPQIPSRGVDEESDAKADDSQRNKPSVGAGLSREAGFDAGRMNEALQSDSDRPPYEPEGFDDSQEHIPALAAGLSLLAPGAGQIYNGEPDKSWHFGIRFALLVPWYRAVRQAYERAEQIRTYYAPRPEEGATWRAIKYMVSWYIIVGGVAALLGFGGYAAYNVLSRPERPRITEQDVVSAHAEARRQIRLARIDGLDGVSTYLDERDARVERFTMSEKERAERLFRRGYQACQNGELGTCETVMKRVSTLDTTHRRSAYKLQAWASVQRTSSKDEPMPEIEIDSLAEFEMKKKANQSDGKNGASDAPEPDEGAAQDGEASSDDSATPGGPSDGGRDQTPPSQADTGNSDTQSGAQETP